MAHLFLCLKIDLMNAFMYKNYNLSTTKYVLFQKKAPISSPTLWNGCKVHENYTLILQSLYAIHSAVKETFSSFIQEVVLKKHKSVTLFPKGCQIATKYI